MVAYCKRLGVDGPCRLLGLLTAMDPDMTEVASKAMLHVIPHRWLERPAGPGKNLLNVGEPPIGLSACLPREALDRERCPAH
jgi:hypothetical protein